jgi:hypothetical protein
VGSVIETMVLLNVLLMWAWPWATFFFSLRRTFLAPAAGTALGGHSVTPEFSGRDLRSRRVTGASYLPTFFLPATVLLRALAGTRVGVGALAADRQAAAVAQTLVAADLDLAADVGGTSRRRSPSTL